MFVTIAKIPDVAFSIWFTQYSKSLYSIYSYLSTKLLNLSVKFLIWETIYLLSCPVKAI